MIEPPNVGWACFFAHHFTARREFSGNNYVVLGAQKTVLDKKVGKKACPPYGFVF
jgi:hypothetical protein